MDYTADSLEYARNLSVNFYGGVLDVASGHLRHELAHVLERENGTTAFLAGYTWGLLTAMIMLTPSPPQPQQLPLPTMRTNTFES